MLTLQVMSDLHFEFHADNGKSFIDALDSTGVDALVLAGDILSTKVLFSAEEAFKRLAAKYPAILYVPGNHELWGSTPTNALTALKAIANRIPNMTLLNNDVAYFSGYRIIGGPMWFPQWSPLSDYLIPQMNDFSAIKGFRSWAPKENKKFKSFLEKNLKEGDVVVTHYLPSNQSVAPQYKGSKTNDFFVSEMDSLILERSPALWIHGHTHNSFDYQLSSTRIVCNPFGYPNQLNFEYQDKLLIPLS